MGIIAVVVGLDGVESAAFFEVVKQFFDEYIQQVEVTPDD